VTTGAPNKGLFPQKPFLAPALSWFAGLSPILIVCAGLVIAPVPAAAQFIGFGGFGSGGGLGILGLMHHGYSGGFGSGRGRRPPGFMSYGIQGKSSWGQYRGQPQSHQRSPFGAYGGAGHRQPPVFGTGESSPRPWPSRGNCDGRHCPGSQVVAKEPPPTHWPPHCNAGRHVGTMMARGNYDGQCLRLPPPPPPSGGPPVIGGPNLQPRRPAQPIVTQATPPPPQAPKPPERACGSAASHRTTTDRPADAGGAASQQWRSRKRRASLRSGRGPVQAPRG
jgi:hypothetical protein